MRTQYKFIRKTDNKCLGYLLGSEIHQGKRCLVIQSFDGSIDHVEVSLKNEELYRIDKIEVKS